MKRESIDRALDEIRDTYIEEAGIRRPRKRKLWISLLTAAMSLLLVIGLLTRPASIAAYAVSLAEYPEYQWQSRPDASEQASSLTDFFRLSIDTVLSGSDGDNRTYSPINLYMALSVLAELTGGTTREQILELLRVNEIEKLRKQTNEIWNACYIDNKEQTLLANSLWLDRGLEYVPSVMDTLADNYYTSVYQRELSDPRTARDIRAWLNNNTGNMLSREAQKAAQFDESTLIALYSTVYFRAKWSIGTEFRASDNTEDVFHAPDGDVTCTYMNKKHHVANYYWAPNCSAVTLSMKDANRMWLILPDEGCTVYDILESGTYMDLFTMGYEESENGSEIGSKYMMVNLSLPKFDVRWSSDLRTDLENMGVTEMFDMQSADFSTSILDPVYITGVNQATRVCVDEEGVTAASYIEIPGATSPAPPDEIIDFVLDRPFLFIIENRYDIPLFAGVVNDPTEN